MNELPPDARAFLASARGAHDPHDPEARTRVEARLMAALGLSAVVAPVRAEAASRVGGAAFSSWLGGSKIMLASLVLGLMAGGVWLMLGDAAPRANVSPRSVTEPSASSLAVGKPELTPLTTSPTATPERTPRSAVQTGSGSEEQLGNGAAQAAQARSPAHARRAAETSVATTSTSTLAAETALLARASAKLSERDARAAEQLLAEHVRRYPQSQLHEEREGFLLMARCLRGAPEATGAAESFVSHHPTSVIIPRLSHLCSL